MDLRELIQARLDNRDRERAEAEARKRAAFEEAQRRVRELEAQHREMMWRMFLKREGR